MTIDHIFVARILFTLMTAAWSLLTVFADFNKTHATNPKWTPHSRFHVVWQISSYVGLGVIAFAVIFWWLGLLAVERLYLVLLMGAMVYAGFFAALITMRSVAVRPTMTMATSHSRRRSRSSRRPGMPTSPHFRSSS